MLFNFVPALATDVIAPHVVEGVVEGVEPPKEVEAVFFGDVYHARPGPLTWEERRVGHVAAGVFTEVLHFSCVHIDFEKDIALVALFVTAEDPEIPVLVVEVVGEVVHFEDVLLGPGLPLQRGQVEHVEEHFLWTVIFHFGVLPLLDTLSGFEGAAEEKYFALVDKDAAVRHLARRVASDLDFFPLGHTHVVPNQCQADPP